VKCFENTIQAIRAKYPYTLSTTIEEDLIRLYSQPMTVVNSDGNVENRVYYIHILYFITPIFNRFESRQVHTLPIPIQNEQTVWREFDPQQRKFLINSGQTWVIDDNSFQCIYDSTVSIVTICFFQGYTNTALDECSKQIFSKG